MSVCTRYVYIKGDMRHFFYTDKKGDVLESFMVRSLETSVQTAPVRFENSVCLDFL